MGNIFLFSLIVSLVFSIIIYPFSTNKTNYEKHLEKFIFIVIITVLNFLIIFGFYYLSNKDRNITSLWFLLSMATILGVINSFNSESKKIEFNIKLLLMIFSIITSIYFIFAAFFNAEEKYNSAKMEIQTEIEAFNENQKPASVPPQFAENKMKKAFSQVPNTSYYELGNLQIQKVNEEYVYIAPVEFSGFFKWVKNKKTPGYFSMSATDSSANPSFTEFKMKYTPSCYFSSDLIRHIRDKYPNYIFYGEPQLEVDDDGTPYYIRTYGKFVSARNGFKIKGIVLVNPTNGKTKKYSLDDVPEFIDGAVSPEAVSIQNSYYGKYVHGFWNSLFSKSDVKLPSDEGTEANVSPIFDENSTMYYFTDFTSPKEEVDSMLGYSLTNARTGEAIFYTGNLEESYMDSQGALEIISKKFIEKEWSGKMPILYNLYGETSWLTPVLDSNSFLQNYFIVSAANPEILAYASTPNEALKKYKVALQNDSSSLDNTSKSKLKTVSGKVTRVYKEKQDEYTYVYFLLDNNKSFLVSSETNSISIYLKENDTVKIKYYETEEDFLPVKEIEIKSLK